MGRTLDKSVLVGVGLVVALMVVNAGLAYRNAATTELAASALGLVFVGALVYLVRRSLNDRSRAAALVHEQRERLHTSLTSFAMR
jgi:O-antigen ligase